MTLQVELDGTLFLGVWIEEKGRDFGMNSVASAVLRTVARERGNLPLVP